MDAEQRHFPKAAGVLFGLGLGGFFDGIVLHQLLQWHHMLSSWYPVNTIENLELNTLWDGTFHSTTYLFVVAGLFVLWGSAQRRHLFWSSKLLAGTVLLGFGLFNTAEGIINHHVLGLHHVNETVAHENWVYWDISFTFSGLVMLAAGWLLLRQGERETAAAATVRRGQVDALAWISTSAGRRTTAARRITSSSPGRLPLRQPRIPILEQRRHLEESTSDRGRPASSGSERSASLFVA